VCGIGGGEADQWRASDPVEDSGFASLLEDSCVCLAKKSRFDRRDQEWLKRMISKMFPPVLEGNIILARDRSFLAVLKIGIRS
jgi:hypothetical protein